MRGMILAAGRGERMGELTLNTPKPLLQVAGYCLIEYVIANFKRAGIKEIVINISYHGEQIRTFLGDGKRYGVKILYSEEDQRLEVGGGIFHALPLLGDQPFIVMSGDIITDYPLANLPQQPKGLAHLVLVDNPAFHPLGDLGLRDGYADLTAQPKFNFANMGVYRPELFSDCQPGYFPWRQFMFPVIERGQVTAEYYQGKWCNIGTPLELAMLNARSSDDFRLLTDFGEDGFSAGILG